MILWRLGREDASKTLPAGWRRPLSPHTLDALAERDNIDNIINVLHVIKVPDLSFQKASGFYLD